MEIYGWLLDAAIVGILAAASPGFPLAGTGQRVFAPLMLLCLIRLVPRIVERNWLAWIGDRSLLTILLAVAAGAGALHQTVYLAATALALLGILWPGGKFRLTRV